MISDRRNGRGRPVRVRGPRAGATHPGPTRPGSGPRGRRAAGNRQPSPPRLIRLPAAGHADTPRFSRFLVFSFPWSSVGMHSVTLPRHVDTRAQCSGTVLDWMNADGGPQSLGAGAPRNAFPRRTVGTRKLGRKWFPAHGRGATGHIVTHIFFPHTEARRHGEKTRNTKRSPGGGKPLSPRSNPH